MNIEERYLEKCKVNTSMFFISIAMFIARYITFLDHSAIYVQKPSSTCSIN